jgi:hypothetical protein
MGYKYKIKEEEIYKGLKLGTKYSKTQPIKDLGFELIDDESINAGDIIWNEYTGKLTRAEFPLTSDYVKNSTLWKVIEKDIKEEEGHSKYYPGGKTPGLTTSVMNKILKNIAKGDDKDKEVKEELEKEDNPQDIISVDVPLFIRLLEYAREDAQTDMDLHDVAENIIKLSAEGEPLTMANYDDIVGTQEEVSEDGAGGSMSNAAGGYLGKFAYKLPKKQPKLEEETEAPKPNAKNPGASLGAGPSAGKSGVSNNAYVKQFKYKVVPQTAEGTYVQKGSGMEVKKLF